MIKIKKGLDLPIQGAPEQTITDTVTASKVAILGQEYIGMRPTMHVQVGDVVKKGQILFEDKKNPGVKFVAPASGEVVEVNRGDKRVLQSVVISVSGNETVEFTKFDDASLANADRQALVDVLVDSALWTTMRTRPFSKVPAIDSVPHSIFVTAMDTNPLAVDPQIVIAEREQDFAFGLKVLAKLTEGKLFVNKAPGANIPAMGERVEVNEFAGPHPAGLPGTHIHYLDPVGPRKKVWHINYQDVIAIGATLQSGDLDTSRVISIAGPMAKSPKVVRTQLGASVNDLIADQTTDEPIRVISGSVLNGTNASGPHAYLGRYHYQVSLIKEDREKKLFGWIMPGSDKHSVTRAYLGHLGGKKLFDMTSTTNGSDRSMVPIGNYERIMPLDVIPTLLLRDILSGDTDGAQNLGALELDEEDLSLCTYVCPGKYDYGPELRDCLSKIEAEG
ncbi:Na(+)-translocating NADH-quinone reductase subunit A [Glaciecola sp. XM2]|jgi:Na+-transporting NADH:ubiquinone oxidoreductase subunit A|uniref:Na(+)-translocating NADH-quinone reductase subunit A n=1 Tax=Glaciecola sp. XM2 TaxID=1914931 RepID=UPI001BDE895B|nr:Na(+)-translocating NADH-quinone reductase subunit A [Glaciecola sp. XM2]MBT1451095.1 Na(+)-translocating NADH-quinone reductase subunit A [Glaciecola sp. XM2]